MHTTVVFPGSFDPITLGHEDLIVRASRLFSRVIVAVAANTNKAALLSHEQRLALVQRVVGESDCIEVKPMMGLLVDFLREHDSKLVLRGMRCVVDMNYEQQMSQMNQSLMSDMETVFLWSRPEFTALTSSAIREVHRYGGSVSHLVSAEVLTVLDNC